MRVASFDSCAGNGVDHFAGGYAAVCFGHSASTSESGRRPRASNRRINQPAALRASDPEK
jgi:hypothetical protein